MLMDKDTNKKKSRPIGDGLFIEFELNYISTL